jgi:hypothetical protein
MIISPTGSVGFTAKCQGDDPTKTKFLIDNLPGEFLCHSLPYYLANPHLSFLPAALCKTICFHCVSDLVLISPQLRSLDGRHVLDASADR